MKDEAIRFKDVESTKSESRVLMVLLLICCDLKQVTVTLWASVF